MKTSVIKLLAALSMVLVMVGCEITVVEAYSFESNYKYVSYCTDKDHCKRESESSYIRISGDLIKDNIVTIHAYLPGDPTMPYLDEQFYYNGRGEDNLGTYYDFQSVSESPATSFFVYDHDYATWFAEDADWMYNFSNIIDLYKKRAK